MRDPNRRRVLLALEPGLGLQGGNRVLHGLGAGRALDGSVETVAQPVFESFGPY